MALQYQPLTESFRELNRMLTEKQSWDAENKAREAQQGLQNLVASSQLDSARQQQELTQFKIQEQERMNTPVAWSMNYFAQGGDGQRKQLINNPLAIKEMKRVLIDGNQDDWTFDNATGYFVDKDKNPFKISPEDMKFRAPGMFGVIDHYTDVEKGMMENVSVLDAGIKATTSKLTQARGAKGYGQAVAGETITELTDKLTTLKAQRKDNVDFFKPENLMSFYKAKSDRMSKRASYYNGIGAYEMSTQMQRNAESAENMVQKIVSEETAARNTKKQIAQRGGIEFDLQSGKFAFSTDMAEMDERVQKNAAKLLADARVSEKVKDRAHEYTMLSEKLLSGEFSDAENRDFQKQMKALDRQLARDLNEADDLAKITAAELKERGTAEQRLSFGVGTDIVQKSALPQGMIIPHEGGEANFRDAADKRFTEMVRELEGGVVTNAADARALGHEALAQTVAMHEQGNAMLRAWRNASGTGRFSDTVTVINPATGKDVNMTKAQYTEKFQKIRANLLETLGYLPTWEFESRN